MRAILEGICFNLHTVLKDLSKLTGRPNKIIATGGLSRSDVWRQLLTDVFNQPIDFPENIESSCLGTAVIGLKGINKINDITEVQSLYGMNYWHKPQPKEAELYKRMFPIYEQLSLTFTGLYHQISEFQKTLG